MFLLPSLSLYKGAIFFKDYPNLKAIAFFLSYSFLKVLGKTLLW